MGHILRGSVAQAAEKVDLILVDDLRSSLFATAPAPFAPGDRGEAVGGLDLASINIQRGRDHGIGDYASVVAQLGLPNVTSYRSLTGEGTSDGTGTGAGAGNTSAEGSLAERLEQTYGPFERGNLDLFVGGLAEPHVANASVGRTFATIIERTFRAVRADDLWWFTRSLSEAEQGYLGRLTLAEIIRLNTDVSELETPVFFVPDRYRHSGQNKTDDDGGGGGGGGGGAGAGSAAPSQGTRSRPSTTTSAKATTASTTVTTTTLASASATAIATGTSATSATATTATSATSATTTTATSTTATTLTSTATTTTSVTAKRCRGKADPAGCDKQRKSCADHQTIRDACPVTCDACVPLIGLTTAPSAEEPSGSKPGGDCAGTCGGCGPPVGVVVVLCLLCTLAGVGVGWAVAKGKLNPWFAHGSSEPGNPSTALYSATSGGVGSKRTSKTNLGFEAGGGELPGAALVFDTPFDQLEDSSV
jgi:hypothetical protein